MLIQVDRLVGNAAAMTGRIIRLLAETGMRQEEVRGLERSQVSMQRREIRLTKTKTKTSSPRTVPLSDIALSTLVGTPRHITSPVVFWHDDGQRYSTFANIFAVIARRVGVPFRCHDLRHAFASRFLQATGNIPALQAILGHRSIQMTMRYAHMVTGHLHQAMTDFGAKDVSSARQQGFPTESPATTFDQPSEIAWKSVGGGGWIRANVGARQRIYRSMVSF